MSLRQRNTGRKGLHTGETAAPAMWLFEHGRNGSTPVQHAPRPSRAPLRTQQASVRVEGGVEVCRSMPNSGGA